jgi:uncharacterized membrane protein YebE (DUF533 family)
MTDWFETEVPIDAAAAAMIARGMRQVAQADGMIHQRELALIASFEAGVPEVSEAEEVIRDQALRTVFLRSLIMVALADGRISEAETARIEELALEQGIPESEVEAETLSVKRRFLSVFAGVDVFRDAVVRVARDLGLPDAEVDALQQEA